MGFFRSLFKKDKDDIQKNNQGKPVLDNTNSYAGYPSNSGLYPAEIMMLLYAPNFKTSEITFPDKFRIEYGVGFPNEVFRKLETSDYIRKSDAIETLNKLKLTELKEIAVENGLKTSGKKAEIVDRISENISNDQLEEYKFEQYWVLTEKGLKEADDNKYLRFLLEKHSYNILEVGISLLRLNELHKQNEKASVRDLIWGELNRLCISSYTQAFQNGNFSQYCSVLNIMSCFLEEESKYLEALQLCAKYQFYHINFEAGMKSIQRLTTVTKINMIDTMTDLYYMDIEILPYMATRIKDLMSKSGLSSNDINRFLLTNFNAISDEGYLSKKQTVEFIIDQLVGNIEDSKSICLKATKAAKRKIRV